MNDAIATVGRKMLINSTAAICLSNSSPFKSRWLAMQYNTLSSETSS